jgi:DNA-binding CsgD family transcriptional regulator
MGVIEGDEYLLSQKQTTAPIWLSHLLSFVGYGIGICDSAGKVQFCNALLIDELAKFGVDMAEGKTILQVVQANHVMLRATTKALGGLPSTVRLTNADSDDCTPFLIAIGPIQLSKTELGLMITSQKERLCDRSSLFAYGQVFGLTQTETIVLHHLSSGETPENIAKQLTLCISTIRSHIRAILAKVGVANIRSLSVELGRMPPLANIGSG